MNIQKSRPVFEDDEWRQGTRKFRFDLSPSTWPKSMTRQENCHRESAHTRERF